MRALLVPSLLVVGASVVPLIAVRYIAARHFDLARDTWLLGLAWIAAVLVAVTVSLPFGLICGVVLWHWRSWNDLPAVLTWIAIVGTWTLAQAFVTPLREWLPLGWRVAMLGLIVFACVQRAHGMEVKGTTGSRILLACLLVLVFPFTLPIEWGAYAVAFWLTSSWVALVALAVAISWRYPDALPWVSGASVLVLTCYAIPWTRRALLDRTPRGSSLDGLRMRWRTNVAMVRVTLARPDCWLVGWGPNPAGRIGDSLEAALSREAVRLSVRKGDDYALNTSPTHCEPLEVACTYGLVGVAAMTWLALQVGAMVRLGDPWAAAAIAGAVLACATIPARAAPVGVVWLITLAVVTTS